MPRERAVGLRQDPREIVPGEGQQLTRIGKRPAGPDEVGRLFTWNAPAATNRMWSVRTDTVLRVEGGSLDDRQQVPAGPPDGRRRVPGRFPAGDLVDLVEKKRIPDCSFRSDRQLFYALRIHPARRLFLLEEAERGRRPASVSSASVSGRGRRASPGGSLPSLRGAAPESRESSIGAAVSLYSTSTVRSESFPARSMARNRSLVSADPTSATAAAWPPSPGAREQQVEEPLLGGGLRLVGDFFHLLRPDHPDSDLDEIPDHRLDVAPHVPTSVNFERLHLTKGACASSRACARSRSSRLQSARPL